MKRHKPKEKKNWKDDLPKLNSLLKRNKDDNKLSKCPHIVEHNSTTRLPIQKCKRGGYVRHCIGMSLCDYYKDLQRR